MKNVECNSTKFDISEIGIKEDSSNEEIKDSF